MVRTRGLTHIAIAVKDLARSRRFYEELFGAREYFSEEGRVDLLGPGDYDVLTLQEDAASAGRAGGVVHFGFRLVNPEDIDEAVNAVVAAGGTLLRRGEFSPGYPYAYVHDPDGYEIEIWYE